MVFDKTGDALARVGGLAIAGAALGMTPQAASAATTTLDFSGNICGPTGDAACSNFSQIGQSYGNGTGVDVSYRSYVTATGVTSEAFLKYWGSGYGDLTGSVWGGSNASGFTSEITFTALAGYELTILGFDAGCYQNRASCRQFPFSITEIGGGLAASGTNAPPANGRDSQAFSLSYSQTGYVLSWGPDGYDGGLDNIRFDVRATAVGVVPEPGTWALLILGFGIIGGAMRTSRRVRLTAAA